MQILMGLIGMVALLAIAVLLSNNRKAISLICLKCVKPDGRIVSGRYNHAVSTGLSKTQGICMQILMGLIGM
ncbi:hypothetical protein CKQ90_31330, partial [Klebsiella pneumoniae]